MGYLLLLLFLLMLYANPALLVPALDSFRPAQLAGITAAVVLVMRKSLAREKFQLVWPETYLLFWFVAAAALSCFGAFWPYLAFETTQNLLKIAVIFFVICNCVDSIERLQIVVVTLVAGGMFPAAGTLRNYASGIVVEGNRASWIGTFGNPNDLAYSLVLLVPLAVYLAGTVRWTFRPILWVVIATFLAAIFASHSRGGMMGLFAVLAVAGFRRSGVFTKVMMTGLLAAVLVFATYFWTRDAGFGDLQNDFTVHQRIETIKTGLRMFADRPLFGVGLGCSIVAWPLYVSSDIDFTGSLVTHNTMVEALSESGIFGFVPFLLLLVFSFLHVHRLSGLPSDPETDPIRGYAVALEAALCGYVVCGLSGGYVVSWFPYIVIGLICALFLLYEKGREDVLPMPFIESWSTNS